MGLRERRAIKTFQSEQLPTLKARLDEAAGFEVELEVHWDQLAIEGGWDHLFPEAWKTIFFRTVIEAFESIAADDMGQSLLKQSVRSIVFKNESGSYGAASAISFENGVITIDHEPVTNADDYNTEQRVERLRKLIEEATPEGAGGLGLRQRRAIEAFQRDQLPGLRQQLDEITGPEVELEVKWDQLAGPGEYDHLFSETWPKVYFHTVLEAFKAVAIDELGQEALRDGVKKIVFKNESGNTSVASAISFEDGVITIDHDPVTNVDSNANERAAALQKMLEDAL